MPSKPVVPPGTKLKLAPDQIVRGENIYKKVHPKQPKQFTYELALSLVYHGQQEPIKVHARPDGKYNLIAGFYRYDAALIIRKINPTFRLDAVVVSTAEVKALLKGIKAQKPDTTSTLSRSIPTRGE